MAERVRMEQRWQWRGLRMLLPQWYAEAYGTEVLRAHEDAAGGMEGARGGVFWMRVGYDVVITALGLRLDASRVRFSRDGGRKRGRDVLRQVMAHAWRGIARDRGFSAAVVVTLGLGIGAVVTMFTVLDRLLLSPPAHVQDADGLRRVLVHGQSPFSGTIEFSSALSWPDYQAMQRVAGSSATAAFAAQRLTLGSAGESEELRVELASASYFPVLGVTASQGRVFTAEDDRIGVQSPAALLSHEFWQRRFGGGTVLGRQLRIGKGTYTVVGVMPPGFTGVDIAPVDAWLPLLAAQTLQAGSADWEASRRWYWLQALVRVPPAGAAALATQATAAYRRDRAEVQRQDPNARIELAHLIAARGPSGSDEARVARLLGGLALLVLLIACANVANLMLARGIRRRRGLALRSAIGGTRARLVGELLMEALMLSAAAAAVALLFTRGAAPVLFRTLLPDALLVAPVSLRLLAIAVAACAVCTLLSGVLPALRSTRLQLTDALRSGRATPQTALLRRLLLLGQAALCAILLAGAGMFLRSLQEAGAVDMGVDLDAVAVQLELDDGTQFGEELQDAAYTVRDQLRSLPFVQHAAVTTLPHFNGTWGVTLAVNGDSLPFTERGPAYYGASGQYFEAMGLSLLRGRALADADDRPGAPAVAVVSDGLMRALFPGGDGLGRCVTVGAGTEDIECVTVVGVVEDVMPSIRAELPSFSFYMPNRLPQNGLTGGAVVLRTRGAPGPYLDEIMQAARSAHPDVRFADVQPMASYLEYELRPWRLGAGLLSAFGVLALLIAATGLYSVLAFDVAQRRFELGLRTALGASAAALVQAVTLRALGACVIGLAAGIVAAIGLARMAGSLLFRVGTLEPAVYAGVAVVLLLTCVVAAALPARRAVRTDPRITLQAD